jgi:hypothetical protein
MNNYELSRGCTVGEFKEMFNNIPNNARIMAIDGDGIHIVNQDDAEEYLNRECTNNIINPQSHASDNAIDPEEYEFEQNLSPEVRETIFVMREANREIANEIASRMYDLTYKLLDHITEYNAHIADSICKDMCHIVNKR